MDSKAVKIVVDGLIAAGYMQLSRTFRVPANEGLRTRLTEWVASAFTSIPRDVALSRRTHRSETSNSQYLRSPGLVIETIDHAGESRNSTSFGY